MGKPLDEPTKILGFFPFGDAVMMFVAMLGNGFVTLIVSKITAGFFAVFFFGSITLLLVVIFTLKNIFPPGFFPGLWRHMTTPRLKLPGRERSEI